MKERRTPHNHNDEVLDSLAASRERRKRQEAARKARNSRLMRRFMTPLAIASALGAGIGIYAATRGEEYHPRATTVHLGDTLSEIAEEELQKQGDTDPSTQEINDYTEKIADANADEISGSGPSVSAHAGDTLTLPKK